MRRGLWFAAGAGAGIYAMTRARRLVEAFTVDGLRDRWEAVGLGARMLREDVAQAQAEKETELRERYGLVPHGTPELGAGQHRAIAGTGPSTSREGEGSN